MLVKKILLKISLILFITFILFSFLVAKEIFAQFDFDTTVKFQDHISRAVDFPFSILSIIGSTEITGIFWLISVIFFIWRKYYKTILALCLLPLALVLELLGKLFVLHPAPPHLFYRGIIKFDFPSSFVPVDYSYPSGHITRTAFLVIFLISFWYFRKFKFLISVSTFLVLFLLAMIISRIYLGEHWSTDVIGGLLIGSSFGLMAAVAIPVKSSGGPSKKLRPSN